MNEFNSDVVVQTLKKVVDVLEENDVEYRVIGSVLVAAIKGKLYRNLGDLDLLVDIRKKDILYKAIMRLGYTQAKRILFEFGRRYYRLETLDHPTLLEVGYFYGTWGKDDSFLIGNKYINVYIEGYAVKNTEYTLHGIRFKGIPRETVATNTLISKSNPKRQRELQILKMRNIDPYSRNFIHINIFGISADWMYQFAVGVLDFFGKIRIKLGLPFEPWR